jgi:ubiquinone/menaquinone biosynthesis C-methylase UbiE
MRIEEPLLSCLSPLRFKRILDVGCGYGRVTSYLKIIWPDAEVIALDISRKSVLYVKKPIGVDCLRADGLKLPLRDEAFDLVTCTQVIEHVERDLQPMFVAELSRVLRRGGLPLHNLGALQSASAVEQGARWRIPLGGRVQEGVARARTEGGRAHVALGEVSS